MNQKINISQDRPCPRLRPFKAMKHMRALINDKEDTAQVFHIIEALNGNALKRNFSRMLETEKGQASFGRRRDLAPLLDDHAELTPLPADSVGRAYIDFMKREGLSAAGLVEESEINRGNERLFDDDLTWFGNRLRDTHDLYHVLSGYGRDALGEAALLTFTHGQQPSRGVSFIAFMGFRHMRRSLPRAMDLRAVWREARMHGRAAEKIVDEDILALLYEPLEDARKRLKIARPTAYKQALNIFENLPDKPATMMTA